MEAPQLLSKFLNALKELYWSEKQQTLLLPKLQQSATTIQLKSTIEDHLLQTKDQLIRIEKIGKILSGDIHPESNKVMEDLFKEAHRVIRDTPDGSITRDAEVIAALQKIEHYEISSYGALEQIATSLGYDEIVELLKISMEEERLADMNLTEIAENNINNEAKKE